MDVSIPCMGTIITIDFINQRIADMKTTSGSTDNASCHSRDVDPIARLARSSQDQKTIVLGRASLEFCYTLLGGGRRACN